MRPAADEIDTGTTFQRNAQRNVQRKNRDHSVAAPFDVLTEHIGFGADARGWTMIADSEHHPDRPIGLELGGLGYDVAPELDWQDREPLPGFSFADAEVS